jgi:hypothetical protein
LRRVRRGSADLANRRQGPDRAVSAGSPAAALRRMPVWPRFRGGFRRGTGFAHPCLELDWLARCGRASRQNFSSLVSEMYCPACSVRASRTAQSLCPMDADCSVRWAALWGIHARNDP